MTIHRQINEHSSRIVGRWLFDLSGIHRHVIKVCDQILGNKVSFKIPVKTTNKPNRASMHKYRTFWYPTRRYSDFWGLSLFKIGIFGSATSQYTAIRVPFNNGIRSYLHYGKNCQTKLHWLYIEQLIKFLTNYFGTEFGSENQ